MGRPVPRLTKNERAILEASEERMADRMEEDSSSRSRLVSALMAANANVVDQKIALVERGLAQWTVRPGSSSPDGEVSLEGEIRVTYAGLEALRRDTRPRRALRWLTGGIPRFLWGLFLAGAGAAIGAAVTAWLT